MSSLFVNADCVNNATREMLQYTDVQDDFGYTKAPEANVMLVKTSRQITNTVRDERTINPKDPYTWGAKDVKIQIDKMVDIMGPCTIYIDIGPLTNISGEASAPNKELSWVNGLGFALFESIEVRCDTQGYAQRIEPLDQILENSLFTYDETRADSPTDSIWFLHNEKRQLKKLSQTGFTVKLRLPTWWGEHYRNYFNPKSITTDQMYLYFKFNTLMNLVSYDGWSTPVIPNASINNFKMGQEVFYLNPAEEALSRAAEYSVMIREYIKTTSYRVPTPTTVFSQPISYSVPVTQFIIRFRDASDESMTNVNRLWDCSEPCSRIQLMINNKVRWDVNKFYCRDKWWKELYSRHPRNPYYLIPLCLDPTADFPTGGHNWNAIQNSQFTFTFDTPWQGVIDIIPVTFNYVTVQGKKLRRSFY